MCIGLFESCTVFTAGLASSSMSYGAAGLDVLYQTAMKQRTWRDIPADAMSKSQLRKLGRYRARMRDQQVAKQVQSLESPDYEQQLCGQGIGICKDTKAWRLSNDDTVHVPNWVSYAQGMGTLSASTQTVNG